MKDTSKRPNGADLLATLINLYCKQEGVKVKFEITNKNEKEKRQCLQS